MLADMRICKHLTCADPAEVWYHGPWCAKHALERYGTTPAIEARFAELRNVAASGAATGAVPDAAPGSGVQSTSRPPAPEPLSDYDLERLLRANNWDELDLEWALISRLEEL